LNCTGHDIGRTIRQAMSFPDDLPLAITPVARGGSQRLFYRVSIADHPGIIFMHYDSTRQENAYYAAQAEFLRAIGVSVPVIFFYNAQECFLLMEDLGETDLWSYRHAPWQMRKDL
jgi:N-acetylmuramate 1-kinase